MTLMGFSVSALARVFGRIGAPALLLAAMVCLGVSPAAAQLQVERLRPIPGPVWGGWEDLQQSTCTQAQQAAGTCFAVSSQADCVTTGVNRIDCFAMVFSGPVARRQWDGQTWQPWRTLPGLSTSQGVTPECVAFDQGRIDCFARDTNGGVLSFPSGRPLHLPGTPGAVWREMGTPPGVLDSDAECLSPQAGRIDCFGRGTDGVLYQNTMTNNTWSGWMGRGGQILQHSKPSCVVSTQRGSILCMFITPAAQLRQFEIFLSTGNPSFRDMTSGGFRVFEDVNFGPRLQCVISNIGEIHCFTPANNGGPLMLAWLSSDGTSPWVLHNSSGSNVGGSQAMSYDWDCVVLQPGRVDCMELIIQGAAPTGGPLRPSAVLLRHGMLTPSTGGCSWYTAALSTAPTGFPGSLDCVSWGVDRIDCFASGGPHSASTALWHAWYAPPPPRPTLINPNRPPPSFRPPNN